MQIQDLLQAYQSKTDEELMQLAKASEQLTSEAQLALKGELCRRHISITRKPEISQADTDQLDAGLVRTQERGQPQSPQGVVEFVAEVLRMYHSYFWLFFKITAPAVTISTIAIITSRNEGREIARHVSNELLALRIAVVEAGLLNLFSLFVSWMAFSLSFAAICIAMEEARAGYTPSASHSLLNVRERSGTFVRLSSLLFALMMLLMVASVLVEGGAVWAVRQLRMPSPYFLTMVVIWMMVGLRWRNNETRTKYFSDRCICDCLDFQCRRSRKGIDHEKANYDSGLPVWTKL